MLVTKNLRRGHTVCKISPTCPLSHLTHFISIIRARFFLAGNLDEVSEAYG